MRSKLLHPTVHQRCGTHPFGAVQPTHLQFFMGLVAVKILRAVRHTPVMQRLAVRVGLGVLRMRMVTAVPKLAAINVIAVTKAGSLNL